MIPIHKLSGLPASQRLRKAAKLFGGAEHRFILSGRLSPEETEYLGKVTEMLAGGFTGAARDLLKKARENFVCGNDVNSEKIRRALNTVYHLLLAETGRYQADWDFIGPEGPDPSKRHPFPGMRIYLEDIRSPFNVGSMFRAAESFGAEKIWLSPLCADPRHKRAERSAMGCVDLLPWERLSSDPFTGHIVFPKGSLFALETGGTPLGGFAFPSQGILIAGSEELGVSPEALAAADASLGRVSIPTWGAKGSLNVSVAFGIVMQAWADKLDKRGLLTS
jgi:TrmH family RNA methyltransferase